MPNPQAQIDATSQWYLQQGVLGATVMLLLGIIIVLCLVIRHLYRDNQKTNDKLGGVGERAITALNGASNDLDKVHESLQAIKSTLDMRTQALGDLSTQMALTAAEQRHGFGNIAQIVSGILSAVQGAIIPRGRNGGAP